MTSQDPATIEKERNPTFRTVMGALTKSLQSGDVLKGIKVGGRGPWIEGVGGERVLMRSAQGEGPGAVLCCAVLCCAVM